MTDYTFKGDAVMENDYMFLFLPMISPKKPAPNGSRINISAYGNTTEVSKIKVVVMFRVAVVLKQLANSGGTYECAALGKQDVEEIA